MTRRTVLRLGPLGVPVDRRACAVVAAATLLAVAAGLATLWTAELPADPVDVVAAVLGAADGGTTFAVVDVGLPRVLVALLVGAALGIGGALVQALTRNPLGSPDVIGFDAGAAAGALVGILVLRLAAPWFGVLAVVVGALAAAVVFALSARGRDLGYRVVLIGIGVGAALESVVAYLLTRSTATESLSAARWLVGSTGASTWDDVLLAAVGLGVLLPAAVAVARHLRGAALGPDLAVSTGVRVPVVTAVVLLVAVGLSATTVLAAGPIPFVALAAPQIAIRLVGGGRAPTVLSAAALGALLLAASDLLAQRAVPGTDLPVGVVTGVLGGAYLAWLLSHEWRRRSG